MKHYPRRIKCVRVRYRQATIEFKWFSSKCRKAFVYVCAVRLCCYDCWFVFSFFRFVPLIEIHSVWSTHTTCAHWPCYCNRVIPSSSQTHTHRIYTAWDLFLFIMIGVFFSFRFVSFLFMCKHFSSLLFTSTCFWYLYIDTDSIYCRLVFPLNSSYFQMPCYALTQRPTTVGFQFSLLCLWNHRMY